MVTKRTILTIFILVMMTLCSFAQVKDIPGWDKTKWGMKPTEVLNLYKAEGITMPCKTFVEMVNKSFETLNCAEIHSFTIINKPYNVEFQFDDAQNLKCVAMGPNREEDATEWEFEGITKALIEKYGAPKYTSDQKRILDRKWVVGATTIEVLFLKPSVTALGNKLDGILNISYQPTDINKGL